MNVTQVVQVKILGAGRRYTYGWVFDPSLGEKALEVGDQVVIPANQVQAEESSATVVALGSDYNGPMKSIISKVVSEGRGGGGPKAGGPEDDLWAGWETGQY